MPVNDRGDNMRKAIRTTLTVYPSDLHLIDEGRSQYGLSRSAWFRVLVRSYLDRKMTANDIQANAVKRMEE